MEIVNTVLIKTKPATQSYTETASLLVIDLKTDGVHLSKEWGASHIPAAFFLKIKLQTTKALETESLHVKNK